MGDNKLCLLLLLTVTMSKAQDKGVPCLMAGRYKPFTKYEYFYETESLNALNGAVNGPKASCKVEIAAPGTCSYIVRTTDCTLSEVVDVDADGKPVFGAAAGAEDFKTAMERRPLKFTVEGDDDIKLFPEEDELINILNIKRGIVSALAVPVLEEDRNEDMPTIYGLCKTDHVVNTREDVATEVTLRRDLSDCDKFRPVEDHTSPLALISGMNYPLAQLIRSNQTCKYKFNNEQHHMTSGTCTEKHVLALFSHKGEYGVLNTGKQALTLLGVAKYSDRVFDHNMANMKPLHQDSSVDMSPIQDKEAALVVLREIAGLSKTNDGRKRARLAHKLVAVIRKMEAETLTAVVPEALEISQSVTYQALLQCGTPECCSAVMQIFRISGEIDAAVYAMGMIPRSSRVLVKEMLAMAKFKPSKPIYYALSNAVRRLFETDGVTSEIQAVADYALEQIGDCTGDQEHVFLSLKVIGNMAAALGAARPALQSSVIQCIKQPAASAAVQQAAVQVYRQTPVPEEGREVLMRAVLDRAASVQKRVAAYLILMKNPTPAELAQLAAALLGEENPQVKSFIISHISNILSSTAPETLDLKQKIREAFQGNEIEMLMEPNELSRYYRLGSLEGNMIFESSNELPREVMLEMTLNAFGFDMDLIEGKGFEPIVEALFGDDGFFPDTIMKTTLYATDKMPIELNEVLDNMLPFMGNDRKKRRASQNIVNEISHNVNKLIEDLKAQDAPEAMVYLKLLGAELGYLDTKDGKMIHNLLKMIPTDFLKRLLSSVDNELFLHYMFMDNEFYLPTGAGFPLRVALSGIFTPGVKGGLSFNPGKREFALTLSAGIEFVTEFGTHFPDYVHCGLEMHTNIYHESGVTARASVTDSQLKISIPAPHGPTELISITNSLVSVVGAKATPIPAKGEFINMNKCTAFFPGLKYCTVLKYPDATSNDAAPYFPLTGDSKFAVELHPSEEVTEYIATISYAYEDEADKVTFSLKAEGTSHEARTVVILNRQQYSISAELLIDSLQLDSKVSAKLKRGEKLTLEIESDLKLPETTSVQTLILKYENEKIEAEFKSDVRSEIQRIIPNILLDRQIGLNELKVRDVLAKAVAILGVHTEPVITLPERLFVNVEAAVKHHFGQHYYTITLPLPLGGKSTRDLNFPTTLSTPNLIVPHLGLEFESASIDLPEVIIPRSVSLSVPTLGLVELSGKLNSNYYILDAAVSAARDPAESYSAKFEVTGTSPVDLLSLKVEGSALVETTPGDPLKANVKAVLRHKIINATIGVEGEVEFAEKLSVKSKSKLEVTSHDGAQISLEHTGQFGVDAEEISGDGNLEGFFKVGSVHGSGNLLQSVSVLPFRREAKMNSSLKIDSKLLQAHNSFAVVFANGELIILSNNTAYENLVTLLNIAKITFKESQLDLNSHTKAKLLGLKIQNVVETRAGVEAVSIKIETSTYSIEERIHSLITGALDINGLAIHSDASVKLIGHQAVHKAILNLNKDGLRTNGTTSLQSLLSLQELKHTFEITYKNETATAQCKTIGEIMGSHIDHSTELEIAGLSGKIKNHIRFNSRSFNFDTTSDGTSIPFSFNFDASVNGEDYSYFPYVDTGHDFTAKIFLKAEPQSLAHSHECKISTSLDLNNGVEIKSQFESMSDTLLIPSEQKIKVAIKAEVNDYAIKQEISAYNSPARLGLEGSGEVRTNLFNTANTAYQDFAVSGFLKYDKSTDTRSVSLPFIESFSRVPENIRITLVSMGETLRKYINREWIENIPHRVSDFVSKLNFERRVVQLKTLYHENALKLKGLIGAFEKLVSDVFNGFIEALDSLGELFVMGMHIDKVVEILPKYIKVLIFSIIEDVKNILSLINTQGYSKLNEIFNPANAENKQIPAISTSLLVPSFGKLYGKFIIKTPLYNARTSAEFKNASERYPFFTASINSKGTSANLNALSYDLESTAQISIPETSPVIVTETFKLAHIDLTLDQQALLTLNGSSSNNTVFLETSYKNQVSIPSHSLSGEVILIQKAVARQGDAAFTLTVKNEGTGRFALRDFSEEGTHKSDLHLDMGIGAAKLSFTGHTDSDTLQIKMKVNADAVALSHLEFNASVDTESPFIKNSLLVASGKARLGDMMVEIKASHVTSVVGAVSGVLSNAANIMTCPSEVSIDFQNRGIAKINLFESFLANVDVQKDFTVTFNSDIQEIRSVLVAYLNNYNYRHNVTASNNKAEMGVYAVVNSLASFGYLNAAEMFVPAIFKIPATRELNLNDDTGLWYDFTTNDQPVNLSAKLVYQKSWFAPIVDLIVPSLGNLVSEVSFKSSILNLNANAGVYPKDYWMGVSATTASMFQGLKAKLNGTTGLITNGGLKLVSCLSLENAHIGGHHESTLTLEDIYEAVLSVDTVAKINLTSLTIDATHQLSADPKVHPKATSNLKIKYTFDRPDSEAAGRGDAVNTLKLDATLSFISIESTTQVTTNSTFRDATELKGEMANQANIYVSADGLKSSLKATGNGYIGNKYSKLEFDISDQLTLEGDLDRMYSLREIDSKYIYIYYDLIDISINHTALGKAELVPLSTLLTAVDMFLTQPSDSDFDVRHADILPDGLISKIETFSHWFNSSTGISFKYSDVPIPKVVFGCSYNLTSPSTLLEYQGELSLARTGLLN
ncbi:apolipoprotein B-100-like isoform X2 [Pimephales promelas]|uniref:apolipoprotein B-100-like isoform X2 n=1 Tax=Pimephales promelas TaxID=90988 RepID=UPI00195573C7|nr:apolipoprotein B-100-like isoform X2 [Pimephales promelas]